MKAVQVNSELVLHVTRILVLLSKFGDQRSIKTTLEKIMLFDFFMKYPNVMIDDASLTESTSFYDYYSYYHWKPSREEYHVYLRYLTAKGLVVRNISNNEFVYQITQNGNELTNGLDSSYSVVLKDVADHIRKHVSKLSDTKIEQEIIKRIFLKRKIQNGGDENEDIY